MLAMRRESDQYYGHSSASDPNSGNGNRIISTTNYSGGYQQEGTLCLAETSFINICLHSHYVWR